MSYFRICSMRSIQKTTFCGFIALLNKVLDFGGQLADRIYIYNTNKYFKDIGNIQNLRDVEKHINQNR